MAQTLISKPIRRTIKESDIRHNSLARVLMLYGIRVYHLESVKSLKQRELENERERMRKKWQNTYSHYIYFVAVLVVTMITIPLICEKIGIAISFLCLFIAIPPVSLLRQKRRHLVDSVSWKVSTNTGRGLLMYSERIPSQVRSDVQKIIGNTLSGINLDPRLITFENEYLLTSVFLWVSTPTTNGSLGERYCIAHWDQLNVRDIQPLTVHRSERRKTRRKSKII